MDGFLTYDKTQPLSKIDLSYEEKLTFISVAYGGVAYVVQYGRPEKKGDLPATKSLWYGVLLYRDEYNKGIAANGGTEDTPENAVDKAFNYVLRKIRA
jgi:hypothetical protein